MVENIQGTPIKCSRREKMKDEYLTTTEAASICHVTRFTIANWEKCGKLKTHKTGGGHRRILRKNLMAFIRNNHIVSIEKKETNSCAPRTGMAENPSSGNRVQDTGYRIPYCWEFRFKNINKHHCVSCLVFKERANKCFLINKEFGAEIVECQDECPDCEYLNTYYPARKKIIAKTKQDTINYIRNITRKKGDGTSTFFKKGLYISGQYIASIEKTIFRKKEKKRANTY